MHDPSATPTLDATLAATGLGTKPRRDRDRVVAVGQAIGRYVVLERLGAGGMGVVFAAYDPQLDRKVAVKLLKHARTPDGGETDGDRDRLLEEARALAQLSHPNVIAVHDVGVHDGEVFVAMEFIDGVTLTEWQGQDGRTTEELLRVYLAAGAGLAAAHRAGMIHRDFKPDNVMVDHEGRARVLDFGLARPTRKKIDLAAIGDAPPDAPETIATVGTPAYMAPEQFAGTGINARSDQFAFCVALYEALYGERPFRGDTVAELATSTLEQSPAFAGPVFDVSTRVADALHRGLEKRPDARFADMPTLLRQLDTTPRKAPGWLTGLGAIALVGGFAAWSLTPDAPCPRASAVDQQWGPDQLASIERALTTEVDGLDTVGYEATHRKLDTYALAIHSQELRVCSDEEAQRTSGQTLDARRGCLDRRSRQLANIVELSRDDPEKFRKHHSKLLKTLRSVASCGSVETSNDSAPPDRIEAFDRLLTELDDAYFDLVSGELEQPVIRFEEVLAEAEQAELHWVAARAHVSLGQADASRGDWAQAIEHYRQGFRSGLAGGHYTAALDSAVSLAQSMAWNGETREGAYWLSVAEAITVRHPAAEERLVELSSARGSILEAEGDKEGARDAFAKAVQDCHELFGEETPNCLLERSRLADAQAATGQLDEALENYERLIDLQIEHFGRKTPTTALFVLGHAVALRKGSSFEDAIERMQEALSIGVEVWGKNGPRLAAMYGNYASMLGDVGRFSEALEAIDRALEIEEQVSGPEGLMMSFGYEERGRLAALQGDHAQAESDLQHAVSIRAGSYEPGSPYRTQGNRIHAEARMLAGRYEEAIASAQRVLAACKPAQSCTEELAAARAIQVISLTKLDRSDEAERLLEAQRLVDSDEVAAGYLRVARWALDPTSADAPSLVDALRPRLGHANLTLAWLAAQP